VNPRRPKQQHLGRLLGELGGRLRGLSSQLGWFVGLL